jgi:hypothetical protein
MKKRALGGIIFLIELLAVLPSVEKRVVMTESPSRLVTQAVFDPSPSLEWEVFFGSTSYVLNGTFQIPIRLALDGIGTIYLVGATERTYLPPYSYVEPDVFVARFDASGRMLWKTFLGASGDDKGMGIAFDNNGFVYVIGSSDRSWGSPIRPFTPGWSYGRPYADAFVAKLDSSGQLLWNTFLGGEFSDEGRGIAVASKGDVYVTGGSGSSWGVPINFFTSGLGDAFVAKLDSSGHLLWNSFIGSSKTDYSCGIVTDNNGNLFVVGASNASWGSPIDPFDAEQGQYRGFVSRFDNDGHLIWNTFSLSSTPWDPQTDIAMDNNGTIYAAFDNAVATYGIQGNRIWNSPVPSFSSYPKYTSALHVTSIALDSCHNVYLPFSVYYCSMSVCPDPPDIFAAAAKTNSDGVWIWHTPYDSMEWGKVFSEATGIAADGRNVYITGRRENKVFLAKLKQFNPSPEVKIVQPQNNAVVSGEVEILAEATDDLGVNRVEFSVDGILKKKAIWPPPFTCTWDTRGLQNGTHVIRARAFDDDEASADDEITVDVQKLALTLAAERMRERARLIRPEYGKIGLTVSNRAGIPVTRFILLRKTGNGDFQFLREISPNEVSNGQYLYLDKYLEWGITYTYRVEARLGSGELAAVSNDSSI